MNVYWLYSMYEVIPHFSDTVELTNLQYMLTDYNNIMRDVAQIGSQVY